MPAIWRKRLPKHYGGHHVQILFHWDNTCTYIHLCVVAKLRYILNILHSFLDKSRTDTAENIVKEETFGSPGLFENRSEHKNGKHIKETCG